MKQLERLFGVRGAALDSVISIRNGYLEYLFRQGWRVSTAWHEAVHEFYGDKTHTGARAQERAMAVDHPEQAGAEMARLRQQVQWLEAGHRRMREREHEALQFITAHRRCLESDYCTYGHASTKSTLSAIEAWIDGCQGTSTEGSPGPWTEGLTTHTGRTRQRQRYCAEQQKEGDR